jgi:hypothetical protein
MVRRVIEYGAIVFSGAYGSSATNDWQHLALPDEPAALQPDSCPCPNLDHGHWQRHGFGFGASTVRKELMPKERR